MSRQLTALERRRITGTTTPIDQLAAFEALGIPAHARNPTGHQVIECVAYTGDVRPHLTALQWSVIKDEHIGTGLSSIRNHRRKCERSNRNKENLHRQYQGPTRLLDALDVRGKKAHG